jgi:molybdate transport system substrate-binding protein
MKMRILSIAAALAVLGAPTFAQNPKTVSVIAWNLVQPALDKLIPVFEKKTGYKVNFTWVTGPVSRGRVASGDMFDAAIMAGPIGDVLASGQVVISSVRTLSGMKLSVTVRQGAPKPDISSFDAVKKALLNAKSVGYVDPERGTIGINAWATVQRLGIVEELRSKTVHGTGGPNAQELAAKGVVEITSVRSSTMRWCPASSASARCRGMCRRRHRSWERLAFTRATRREHAHCWTSSGRLKPTRCTAN